MTQADSMDSSTEISIVIPVYNRAHIVGRTLESIRLQTFRPLTVLLVDNHSTDSTMSVLQQWQRENESPDMHITILSETEPGAAAARNKGMAAVTSEFVMFFDSDDTMPPRHVEQAVRAFKSPSRPDIVGWDVNIHTTGGRSFIKHFYTTDAIWHCVMHGSMGTQRYAAKSALIRAAGLWNPGMMGWNDIELGIRLLNLNPKIEKIAGAQPVEVYQQTESITGTGFSPTPAKWERTLDEMERNLSTRRAKRYIQLRRALLAGDYAREHEKTESDRLLASVLAREKCPFYRIIYRIARAYVACNGRGGARLLRPFF